MKLRMTYPVQGDPHPAVLLVPETEAEFFYAKDFAQKFGFAFQDNSKLEGGDGTSYVRVPISY